MDLWLIHVGVWQKRIQYCKAIILQLKINLRNVAHEHTALTSPKNLLEMHSSASPETTESESAVL